VKAELKRIGQEREIPAQVMKKQLSLFKSLTRDVSEPSIELITKLNCDPKRG